MEIAYDRIQDLLEAVSQRLISVDFRQAGDGPFHAAVKWVVASPHVTVMRSRHSAGATFRNFDKVKDGDESFSLIYPVNSSLTLSHLENECRVTAGQPIFTRHDAVCEMGSTQACDFVALVMSPSLASTVRLPDSGMVARYLPDNLSAFRLLKDYVSLLAARHTALTEDVTLSASRHLGELIGFAVSEWTGRRAGDDPSVIGDARLEVALAFLQREFRKPALNVASVAAAQDVSPRYLHKLFERAGIRFTDYVNELRLDTAHTAIVEKRDRPIAIIALDAGFSDIAHFNRLFKRRYGVTPSAVRSRKTDD